MDETDYLTISERVTNDWKEKLEVLRGHHKNQSREQQAQHLEELRVLQEDLLKDITHFMSKVREELRENGVESSQEGIGEVCGEAHSLEEEQDNLSIPCAENKTEENDEGLDEQLLLGPNATNASKTPQPLLLSSLLPNIASLNSSMRVEHPHTQDSTVDTSLPSSKVYSTAYSNGTMTEPSIRTSPVAVASQALPSCQEGRGQTQLLADVVNKLQDVVGIKEEPSRTNQVAKFDRHMQDLKTYYESEISALKEKLSKMEKVDDAKQQEDDNDMASELPGGELKRSHTQSSLNSSQYHDSDDGTEGKMLEEFCKRLQEQLEDNEMQNNRLCAENENITSLVRKLQLECDEAEQKIKSLEEDLKERVMKLEQQDAEQSGKVEAEMEMLRSELRKCKHEREQDLMNIDELLQEVEELQMENRELHNITIDCKMALEERNNEIESLRETVKMHKATEDKYKSVILGLENDLRRLEHSRNRERSMQTHYVFGEERKSHRVIKSRSSEQFVTPSRSGHTCNSPSGKLESPSHTDVNNQETLPCSPKVTAVSKSNSNNLLGEVEQQNSKKSSLNLPADSYCYSPNTSRQDGVTEVTTPKVYTPLTKKKWLESSDPGLFGSTATPTARSGGVLNSARLVKTRLQLSSSDVRIVDLEEEGSARQSGPIQKQGGDMHRNDSLEMEGSVEQVTNLAESAVQAVKDGRVTTEEGTVRKDKKGSYGDWWRKHMAVVARAESRLAELGTEKDQLESALQRTPKPGGIVNRHEKRIQMERQRRLEEVLQEMGRVRMTLKKHRAL